MEEKISLKKKSDVFERLPAGLILGFAGGFFNAYTFVARGGVFCNAQTGNLILMALGLAEGSGMSALKYLVPVFFFILASFLGEAALRLAVRTAEKKGLAAGEEKFLYRSAVLLAETAILTAVGFIPVSFPTLLPNALISSAAALQFHAFRDMNGVSLSTVFCTNNLRLLSGYAFSAAADKDKTSLKKAGNYLLLIALFVSGVFAGYFLTDWAKQFAILFISVLFAALGAWIFAVRLREGRGTHAEKTEQTEKKEVL